MVSWSTRRKISHAFILSFIVIVLFIAAFFVIVYRAPNCHDGLRNQNEVGVDCGGRCPILCQSQVEEPVIYWQRAFMIRSGFYHLAAYIENKNISALGAKVPYFFKVYDANNILLAERYGETFLETNKTSVIFESNVSTGGRVPSRVAFGFDGDIVWTRNQSVAPDLVVSSASVDSSDDFPILSATLGNITTKKLKGFEVVAILYDESGNARIVSKTDVDFLDAQSNTRITFTWPNKFDFVVGRIEIIPRLYPGVNY